MMAQKSAKPRETTSSHEHGKGSAQAGPVLTVEDILRETRKQGVKLSRRTFWNWVKAGLLPKGQRVKGRGNVTYFPAQTLELVMLVHSAASLKDVKLKLSVLYRMLKWKVESIEQMRTKVVRLKELVGGQDERHVD